MTLEGHSHLFHLFHTDFSLEEFNQHLASWLDHIPFILARSGRNVLPNQNGATEKYKNITNVNF